jgi:cold shock CspA family protein
MSKVERAAGTVKFWDGGRFYGFITTDAPDRADAFFHGNDVVEREALRTGERVTFVLGEGRDGKPAARQVTRV